MGRCVAARQSSRRALQGRLDVDQARSRLGEICRSVYNPGQLSRSPGMRSSIRLIAIEGEADPAAAPPPAPPTIESPLREIVTAELRQAILAGRYKPGQRLVEDRLA